MSENKIDPTEVDLKKEEFFGNFSRAIDAWEIQHPGKMPPIIQDKEGNWQWVNRKQRRKLDK